MTYEKGIPDYAMVPAKEMEERVIVPITKGAIYSPVQVTNITEKPKTTITLEEDILVPDTKPDLREILMIDGKSHLAVKEIDAVVKGDDYINLSGEIELQTLYLPEKQEGNLPVISVQTRVPFKDQWHTSMSARRDHGFRLLYRKDRVHGHQREKIQGKGHSGHNGQRVYRR